MSTSRNSILCQHELLVNKSDEAVMNSARQANAKRAPCYKCNFFLRLAHSGILIEIHNITAIQILK